MSETAGPGKERLALARSFLQEAVYRSRGDQAGAALFAASGPGGEGGSDIGGEASRTGFVFPPVHHQTRIASSGGIQQFVGDSCFACNSNGGSQSGNSTFANIEGVLTVPQSGGTYVFQHVHNWSFSAWDSKQGASVGHGMDLVSMTTLAGPEIYATLSVQEIA